MLALLLLPAPPAVAGTSGVSSSAYGVEASFVSGKVTSGFGPVAAVTGSGSKGYKKTTTLSSAVQGAAIGTPGLGAPYLFGAETGLQSHAISGGFGVDTISAAADAEIATAGFTLLRFPAPTVQLAAPFLSVSATGVASSASWGEVVPSFITTSSSASFDSLSISGSLLGNHTLSFSGTATADDVIYNHNGVTVTLDQKLVAGAISCIVPAGCSFTPTSVTTEALDIHLQAVNVGGRIVTGDIILGQSYADPPPALPAPPGLAAMLAGLAGLAWARRRRPAA